MDRLSEQIYSWEDMIDEIDVRVLLTWGDRAESLEEKLAEYENDETARRRADAHAIRELTATRAELIERVEWLLSKYVIENGIGYFTFPDGDTWRLG